MSGLTFILVGCLRSGLITIRGALAVILGGCVDASALVLIATFDLKVVTLYVLGIVGALVVSERIARSGTCRSTSTRRKGTGIRGRFVPQPATCSTMPKTS